MAYRGYRDLTVFQMAYELALKIHQLSKDLGYLEKSTHRELTEKYDEVGRMLAGMMDKADKFCF